MSCNALPGQLAQHIRCQSPGISFPTRTMPQRNTFRKQRLSRSGAGTFSAVIGCSRMHIHRQGSLEISESFNACAKLSLPRFRLQSEKPILQREEESLALQLSRLSVLSYYPDQGTASHFCIIRGRVHESAVRAALLDP